MMKTSIKTTAVLLMIAASFTACSGQTKPVKGTLEGPTPENNAPAAVHRAMQENLTSYEQILNNKIYQVGVWSLTGCPDVEGTCEYGIMVVKKGQGTKLPDVHHGKNPHAWYDAAKDVVWLGDGVMEGTGVHVERLYAIRFQDNGQAYVAWRLDPYDAQQKLVKMLGYSVKDNVFSLYNTENGSEKLLNTITNTVTDMGGLDSDDPLWIGEQLTYDLYNDDPLLRVRPGVKFTTGLVLNYQDTPTYQVTVTANFDDGSFSLSNLTEVPAEILEMERFIEENQ